MRLVGTGNRKDYFSGPLQWKPHSMANAKQGQVKRKYVPCPQNFLLFFQDVNIRPSELSVFWFPIGLYMTTSSPTPMILTGITHLIIAILTSVLKMMVSGSPETLVATHKTIWCLNPEDCNLKNNSPAEIMLVLVETVTQFLFFHINWMWSQLIIQLPSNIGSCPKAFVWLMQWLYTFDVLA
jgi:hypothetical protein